MRFRVFLPAVASILLAWTTLLPPAPAAAPGSASGPAVEGGGAGAVPGGGKTGEGAPGYLVDVSEGGIFIDLGADRGAHPGDRFTVLDDRGRGVATLEVRKAYPGVSLMALVDGDRAALAAGERVRPVAAAEVPGPAAGRGMKLGVLPALVDEDGDPVDVPAGSLPSPAGVAEALNVFRPLAARALRPDEVREVEQVQGPALDAAMARLGLDAVVRWGMSRRESESGAMVFVVLVRRGHGGEAENASVMVDGAEATRHLGGLIARMVGERLGYIWCPAEAGRDPAGPSGKETP